MNQGEASDMKTNDFSTQKPSRKREDGESRKLNVCKL